MQGKATEEAGPQMSVMRTKSIEQSIHEGDDPEYHLKRRLTALDLTVFGVGVIIGAGIFTLTGRAAKEVAGPSIVLSFVLAALCCGLAALCYAEFASTVPVSGSAYTFSYASLGEIVAWIIGWDLLLELLLGSAVVAQGWSSYFGVFLGHLGIDIPESVGYGSRFDLMAFLLVAALTVLVSIGIKESMRVNIVLVALKLFIVLFVIVAGIGFINRANYSPFIPPSQPAPAKSALESPLIETVLGLHPDRRSACSASCPVPRWSSSPTSASTSSRRPPRRPRTRSGTCRSASSARSSSARCSTARSRSSSPG